MHIEVILNVDNLGKDVSLLYFYVEASSEKNNFITMFTIFTQAFCLLVLRDDIFHTSSLFLSFMLSHSLSHRILISVAFLTLAYGAPRLFSW